MAIIFTNLISLVVLIRFYRQEGLNYWHIFRIDRSFIKRDILYIAGFMLIAAPAGFLPNILSAQWLFGSPQAALDLLVRPLPGLGRPFSALRPSHFYRKSLSCRSI